MIKIFVEFSTYGLETIFFKNTNLILSTIILTDYCKLTCKHCEVNNINKIIHPYEDIKDNTFDTILMICLIYTIGFKDMNIEPARLAI